MEFYYMNMFLIDLMVIRESFDFEGFKGVGSKI